jgi:hypothetical protein
MVTIEIPSDVISILLTLVFVLGVLSIVIKVLRQFFKNLNAVKLEIKESMKDKDITDEEMDAIMAKWDTLVIELNTGIKRIIGKILGMNKS